MLNRISLAIILALGACSFVSAQQEMQQLQVPTVAPLLPIALPESEGPPVDYIFEPDRTALLDMLLPRYVQAVMTQALLEAVASEHGARMTAMDNATTNASDMIGRLTLLMNRVRQASITKELMEIIGGAEALKG